MENKHSLTEAEVTLLKELLSPVSLVLFMDTKLLGIGGTVSGCSPAFVAMFIEALSDAAVMYGIEKDGIPDRRKDDGGDGCDGTCYGTASRTDEGCRGITGRHNHPRHRLPRRAQLPRRRHRCHQGD